jgi:hypothetical protein
MVSKLVHPPLEGSSLIVCEVLSLAQELHALAIEFDCQGPLNLLVLIRDTKGHKLFEVLDNYLSPLIVKAYCTNVFLLGIVGTSPEHWELLSTLDKGIPNLLHLLQVVCNPILLVASNTINQPGFGMSEANFGEAKLGSSSLHNSPSEESKVAL